MKKLLIVDVPDYVEDNQIRVSYPGVVPNISTSFKVVTLPSEEEIEDVADYYSAVINDKNDVAFIKGATWLLTKIKGENKEESK